MKRLIIMIVGALLIIPKGADAYWWTGNKWPQGNPTTVTVTITSSIPSAWAYPFGVGMAQWSNAGAKFRFVTSTNSGHNVALKYLWFESALALTYIREGIGNRTTSDRDIDFNSKYSWDVNGASNKYDAHAVFVHELGHWLTLGDLYNSVDTEKTMYGKAGLGETKKRTLHSDDIAGIRGIYGLK